MKSNKIRGIIFDYGGTLDTRGDHWSEVIWDGYQQCGIAVDKTSYRDAYVYGERALAVNPIVTPDFHFIDIYHQIYIMKLRNDSIKLEHNRRTQATLDLCFIQPMRDSL